MSGKDRNYMHLPLGDYRRLLGAYLKPQRAGIALLALLLLGSISLQLINPQIIRSFIDATQSGGLEQALLAAALFLAVALMQRVVNVATIYIGENISWRATNALRADLALHCMRLDMQFHQRRTPGELIERIDGDVTTLASFFSELVIKVLGNGLLLLGILILLLREDWRVGAGLAIYALLTLLALLALQPLAVARWAGLSQAKAEQASFLEERLAGTEDIRANAAEPYVMRRFFQLMRTRLHRSRAAFVMNNLNDGVTRLLYAVGYALGLALGVYLFQQGQLTIGTVYLIIAYIGSLSRPLEEIKNQVSDLQKATASIGRINELLAIAPGIVERPRATLPAGPLAVEFQHVSFGYSEPAALQPATTGDGATAPIDQQVLSASPASNNGRALHAISFRLAPGKLLGVLGRTGSGKTTLSRLLFRLYDPNVGAICLGGVDLRDVRLRELRSRVGLVTQDVQLFQASVRDNLTLFSRRIPDEALLRAIREIGLWEWFQSLPDGLDTRLDAGGGGLSAGQAQLLAFTRVFLKDPGLVILDEASSRIDESDQRNDPANTPAELERDPLSALALRVLRDHASDLFVRLHRGRPDREGDFRPPERRGPPQHLVADRDHCLGRAGRDRCRDRIDYKLCQFLVERRRAVAQERAGQHPAAARGTAATAGARRGGEPLRQRRQRGRRFSGVVPARLRRADPSGRSDRDHGAHQPDDHGVDLPPAARRRRAEPPGMGPDALLPPRP